jgi:hypothetical protein
MHIEARDDSFGEHRLIEACNGERINGLLAMLEKLRPKAKRASPKRRKKFWPLLARSRNIVEQQAGDPARS